MDSRLQRAGMTAGASSAEKGMDSRLRRAGMTVEEGRRGRWAERQHRHQWLLLAAILLLSFCLRLYRLGADSLWYDETVSVHLASQSLPGLMAHTAGDIHPPGYYVLLHLWTRLAGSSAFSGAFLSLFFGVLLVALVQRVAARLLGPAPATLAAFLVAISPYHVWYSQEVRMYTLGAALGMGLLWVVLSATAAGPQQAPAWAKVLAFGLLGALALWCLYYAAFLLLALNLMVAAWWLARRRMASGGWAWAGRWALAQFLVLLLYLPWIPVAWRQATQPPVPPWRSFYGIGTVAVEVWSALSLGQSADPARVWPLLLVVLGLCVLGLAAHGRRARLWWLVGYVFLPIGLIFLASYVTPLYHVRYAFLYAAPFSIIVAAGLSLLLDAVPGRRYWRLVFWAALSLLVIFSTASLVAYHTDPRFARDDHRAAVHFLAERWRPGDAILVNAGYAYTALLTYWDGDPIAWQGRLVRDAPSGAPPAGPLGSGPVLFQTGTVDGDPALGWGDPQSDFYGMDRARALQALEHLFARYHRVWVYRIYDTVTDPEGVLRDWMATHGVKFEEQVFAGEGQLRVQGFLTGRDPQADADQRHTEALADGSLQLLATEGPYPGVEVGGALDMATIWEVERPLAEGVTLFAGLFDDEGQRWAQVDEHPPGSLVPPDRWPVEVILRTPLRLPIPPGTPPGSYRLEVGWYRFVEGQPHWLVWEEGERLFLGEVQVTAPDDWRALPVPDVVQPVGITMGAGLRLVGFDWSRLEGQPGDLLPLDLVWQALDSPPEAGRAVLQIVESGSGRLLAEQASVPVSGRVPFARLEAGQVVRDRRWLTLPTGMPAGVYEVLLGRRTADGRWLPVRRGAFPLGDTYPLVTVRVVERTVDHTPPVVEHPLDARFGDDVVLLGYDVKQDGPRLELVLHWHVLDTMGSRYKIFVHMVGQGGPAEILAQADVYPRIPTTAWVPGEYLSDRVHATLPAGWAGIVVGLYDEATGDTIARP